MGAAPERDVRNGGKTVRRFGENLRQRAVCGAVEVPLGVVAESDNAVRSGRRRHDNGAKKDAKSRMGQRKAHNGASKNVAGGSAQKALPPAGERI